MNRSVYNQAVIQAWEAGDAVVLAALRDNTIEDVHDGEDCDITDCALCALIDPHLTEGGINELRSLCPSCGEDMDDHDMRQMAKDGTVGLCPRDF